ncbi:MAG: hypothetical protein A2504_01585 [Bdellovibrionales bacterium RIFOXYD12_FULL_39_22]|nr:MAG: hypothetical protein A2385_04110 [Bdellovibrionales bacterium RIFOXYB1_FULL_39_21]OFZ42402.1 MAG: hypothetical protein A2485_15385 [Bdellovibrionales bacterium RIFOXYC12_FULL_39_17]OFZ46297.1 MAG: hypothetical protein A2404_13630 [Bdellovibrionales bacterium RIFOXYC1_FULL_39_130]OFZ75190.1 MAG: hypothetical protein A2560_15685 [Bdellovibrionales bacterium RIFOXYD1_FULL_39_84]OFZ93184.1 MAG: hypothetical protein A2504_01585 [Bdellovibrionales bacterium RIFOXYD12_FULL_39_22]HLE11105.1 ph
MKKVFLLLLYSTASLFSLYANNVASPPAVIPSDIEFNRPKTFDFITYLPSTGMDMLKTSFSKKALPAWGGVIASSLLLYYYDEEILQTVQRWGRSLGLGNSDHTRSMIRAGNITIFRGPTDVGSLMYFIGDGWTHFFIGAGFAITGNLNADNRAMQTGSQIFHGMIASTIPNQILKRSFGRESPYRASEPRGAWRPFPSFATYNGDISKHDAMPSGHIMTAAMTFTIIDENYPEYRNYMRPISFTLISLLGLQMINNSVHWASDYPLGIAMGYVAGLSAAKIGKKIVGRKQESTTSSESNFSLMPFYYSNNQSTIGGFNLGIVF